MRNSNDPQIHYDFQGSVGCVEEGDIVTISASGYGLYSVEGAYNASPNWNGMDANFNLAKVTNWKKRIQK